MSGVFEDVHLEWAGKKYTIPAKKMMGAISTIERHLTLKELGDAASNRSTVPLAALASAFGSVLRYAGATIEDEDVYQGMFTNGEQRNVTLTAIEGLMALMIPPCAMQKTGADQSAPKNGNRRQRRAAAAKSSQKLSS